VEQNLWAPAAGRAFDLTPTSLEAARAPARPPHHHQQHRHPERRSDRGQEIGGDHFRSSATWLTQTYPKRTEGADVERASRSIRCTQRFGPGHADPVDANVHRGIDQSGGCGYGYSCVYTDSISWATPHKPLPMIRDPRVVFDQMFSVMNRGGGSDDRSILDYVLRASARLQSRLGAADRARLNDYLDNVREMERRIQVVESRNRSGEPRELPGAPQGVPDNFADHVAMMFDLLLAFKSRSRVFSFKLSRDGSDACFQPSAIAHSIPSHHGTKPDRILELARSHLHVSVIAKFIDLLKATPDGGGTMLDNTLVICGSPMGDPNQHNHKKVPLHPGRARRRSPEGRGPPAGSQRHSALKCDAEPPAPVRIH
jgi:hypothetical protein